MFYFEKKLQIIAFNKILLKARCKNFSHFWRTKFFFFFVFYFQYINALWMHGVLVHPFIAWECFELKTIRNSWKFLTKTEFFTDDTNLIHGRNAFLCSSYV